MNVHQIIKSPDKSLQNRLNYFERQFTYPLSHKEYFYIEHSPDYTTFFRSMGNATIFYLEKEMDIIGVIGVSIRETFIKGKLLKAAYIGDLKIAPAYKGRRAAYRLFSSVFSYLKDKISFAYGVVMDGTLRTPNAYTGKAGIPFFSDKGHRYVPRVTAPELNIPSDRVENLQKISWHQLESCLKEGFSVPSPESPLKSKLIPTWLVKGDDTIGLLEDTQKAKRLFITGSTPQELVSAHLSYFSYNAPKDGINLIQSALSKTGENGIDGLFLCLTPPQFEELSPLLEKKGLSYNVSKAIIYATTDLPKNFCINSSEI